MDSKTITSRETGEKLAANQKAIEYLQNIDFKSLGRSVFKDYLATVSETGTSIGELTVSVEETVRGDEICYYVHAQSHGVLDDVPMGTSVTAYISRGVITLEQTQHEYIKIPNKPLDKKTVLMRGENHYLVKRTITEGEIVKETERIYPLADMKGFLSEGANIMLQRIMCNRQVVPESAKFLTLGSMLNLTYQTYAKLPDSTITVDEKTLPILGIERVQEGEYSSGTTWQTTFLEDGHMTSRITVGSPVRMQMIKLPAADEEAQEPVNLEVSRKDLHWEEDLQIHSHFLERKEELIDNHKTYIRHKPELRALLEDFCQFVLLRKPDDVCSFASDYFASFSARVPAPNQKNEDVASVH